MRSLARYLLPTTKPRSSEHPETRGAHLGATPGLPRCTRMALANLTKHWFYVRVLCFLTQLARLLFALKLCACWFYVKVLCFLTQLASLLSALKFDPSLVVYLVWGLVSQHLFPHLQDKCMCHSRSNTDSLSDSIVTSGIRVLTCHRKHASHRRLMGMV